MMKNTVPQSTAPARTAGTHTASPNSSKTQDLIARRAYELCRGEEEALEDWLQAERQLVSPAGKCNRDNSCRLFGRISFRASSTGSRSAVVHRPCRFSLFVVAGSPTAAPSEA
jgi:hypothetical protein